ncbi:uncharacterized protein LOC128315120 [Acinonyx jubatus]|uniref:Uncharacterized protein LOC128315120 n=1 Tax=Acinonyx jubatus TaxID=32536 RepID=A0ABM3PY31_ACIJB|nr:uncharacterized protein LOC128315120 [Acinonyx jubatus]
MLSPYSGSAPPSLWDNDNIACPRVFAESQAPGLSFLIALITKAHVFLNYRHLGSGTCCTPPRILVATLVFYSGHHGGLGHGGRPSASSPTLPGSAGELMPHGIFSDQRRIQTDGYTLPAFSHHVGSPEVRVTWASHVLCGVNQLSKRTSHCFTLLHCCFWGSQSPAKYLQGRYLSLVVLSGETRLRHILCSFPIPKYSSSSELKTNPSHFLRQFSSIMISSPPPVSKILTVLRDVS